MRPRFAAGEEVIAISAYGNPSVKTEIVEVFLDPCTFETEWCYRFYVGEEKWWTNESYLRKIPPEERTNLIADIWQPEEVTA